MLTLFPKSFPLPCAICRSTPRISRPERIHFRDKIRWKGFRDSGSLSYLVLELGSEINSSNSLSSVLFFGYIIFYLLFPPFLSLPIPFSSFLLPFLSLSYCLCVFHPLSFLFLFSIPPGEDISPATEALTLLRSHRQDCWYVEHVPANPTYRCLQNKVVLFYSLCVFWLHVKERTMATDD